MILIWGVSTIGGLILLGYACRWLLNNPREDVIGGLLWHGARVYAALFHRVRVEGREHIPATRHGAGPLIVVMNHTAGVDPVLVQAVCRFHIRYVMAEDMRLPRFNDLWEWQRVIFVDRVNRSAHGTREALRHLDEGGVLGIYPEGGLERPACHLLPFEAGIGLLVRRSRARVLPVIITGTPQVDPAWASLWRPSRSRLRFMEPIDYDGSGLSATAIVQDLQGRFKAWTGWPVIGEPDVPPEPVKRRHQSADAA